MKKLLLVLPLFATASWAGTTYYSSAQAQPAYNQLLANLNENAQVVFEAKEYVPGFLTSRAVTEVIFNHPSLNDVSVLLTHDIHHSPVSVTQNGRFGAAQIITKLDVNSINTPHAKSIAAAFNGGEPFTLDTTVNVNGDTANRLTINAFDYNQDGLAISASESIADVNMLEDGTVNTTATLNLDQIKYGKSTEINMSPLTFSFNGTRRGYGIYNGTGLVEASKIDYKTDDTEGQIAGFSISSKQQLTGLNTNITQRIEVASIDIDQLPLKAFSVDVVVAGFSADGLAQYMHLVNSLEAIPGSDESDEIMLELVNSLASMVQPNTKVFENFNFVTDQGDINIQMDVNFVGNGSISGYEGMSTFSDLARAYTGTLSVDAAVDAVNLLPMASMLQNPQLQSYYEASGDRISTVANVSDLQLIVNNHPIPIDMMFAEALETRFDEVIPSSM